MNYWYILIIVVILFIIPPIIFYVYYYLVPHASLGYQCRPGLTMYPHYGCMSCDPSTTACHTCVPGNTADCSANGTCIDVSGGKNTAGSCRCNYPFIGKNCEKVCDSTVSCLNGGTCQNGLCVCPSGYAGLLCQTKL